MLDTNKKRNNILALSENERYEYFIRKVVDFEEVWGLYNDGWALLGDDSGTQVFPFWPEKEFAELCSDDLWKGYTPKPIKLELFLEKWIPGMEKDNLIINIFHTPKSKGKIVKPIELRDDLLHELENYE